MKFYEDLLKLRNQDYASYLTIVLMRASLRDLLTPLFCLATEIRRIPFVTSEFTGLMRLRWWQDQILAQQQGKDVHDLIHKLPPLTPWERLKAILQGHEFFLEIRSLHASHEVYDLSQRTDIPLLHLAYTTLSPSIITSKDEQILNQIGLVLTASHLYLQRVKLTERGFNLKVSNQNLMELIKENLPETFTPFTRWLAPFSGYGKALYCEFQKDRKPSLLTLQRHMIWAYISSRVKF
ncbi:MAG TPA: hypothetical protein VNJ29_01575 [Candidatus Nitrosotenuis sp.]|jgi:hypothetical protein|nr:hypothetical protein [Candidatus Nitrosotenuis sp.]